MSRLAVHLCLLALNLQKQKNKCIFYSARNSNSWYHPNMTSPITGHFHQKKESNFVSAAHLNHNKTSRWSCCNCTCYLIMFLLYLILILGYYLLFEASYQTPGSKARVMKSYNATSSKGMCLNFWFMMYGSSLGTLNVYQKVGSSLGNVLWSISGDQGLQRTWLKGQVTFNSTGTFSVSACYRNKLYMFL